MQGRLRPVILDGRLESARLIVRPFSVTDATVLVRILSDASVSRYVGDGGVLSHDEAVSWIAKSLENLARYGYGTGAVVDKIVGQVIGWAGFARPNGGGEEVIYGLAREHWRQGYGTELLCALIGFAAVRRIDPVRATVDPLNSTSVRLLVRHGFERSVSGFNGEADCDLYERWADERTHRLEVAES